MSKDHEWVEIEGSAQCARCGLDGRVLATPENEFCKPLPKIKTDADWWAYKQRWMDEGRAEAIARAKASEERIASLLARLEKLPKPFVPDPATDVLARAMSAVRDVTFTQRMGGR